MTEPHDCPAMQSLLAELATGAAAGHERAWALGHVAGCPTCRTELAELAKVADGLLMLAPPAEPPPEFESAVLARLDASPGARQRRSGGLRRLAAGRRPPPGQHPRHRPAGPGRPHPRRVILAVAAMVAAVVIAAASSAAIVYRHGEQDRAVAEQYRQTLAVADGRYLRAARLVTAAGEQAGTIFLYQGNPSWLLVTVSSAPAGGRYDIHVLDRGGTTRTVGSCQVTNRSGTAGYRLDIPVSRVAQVQLRQGSQTPLTATLPR